MARIAERQTQRRQLTYRDYTATSEITKYKIWKMIFEAYILSQQDWLADVLMVNQLNFFYWHSVLFDTERPAN